MTTTKEKKRWVLYCTTDWVDQKTPFTTNNRKQLILIHHKLWS